MLSILKIYQKHRAVPTWWTRVKMTAVAVGNYGICQLKRINKTDVLKGEWQEVNRQNIVTNQLSNKCQNDRWQLSKL